MIRTLASVAALGLAATLAAPAPTPDTPNWNQPVEPFRVIGPVHYVGTNELAVFLIATPAGHVLIDGGLPESAPLIEASIRKLGFDPADIEVLLITQAHFDHVGSLAALKKASGGRVEVMDGDVPVIESGGRTDYLFGEGGAQAGLGYRFEPVKVDRTLRDGDTVTRGGVTLTARKTPGHTPGSTTWLTTVEEDGKPYLVSFTASTGINPGTRLGDRPSYPGIAEDFARAFTVLESLQPDVFLGGHTGFFRMEEKRARLGQGGANPFVEKGAASFKAHVAARKQAFSKQLEDERAERAR
jgi:metallo-beta-lactamase class B